MLLDDNIRTYLLSFVNTRSLLLLFSLADVATTSVALNMGIPEANPFPHWMIAQHGEMVFYGFKMAVTLVAISLVPQRTIKCLTVMVAIVVILNLFTIGGVL